MIQPLCSSCVIMGVAELGGVCDRCANRKIAVTGGRDYCDHAKIASELSRRKPRQIVVGDCPTGLDFFARDWADCNGVAKQVFIARWYEEGRAAGPRRNGRMLRESRPDLLLAFPGHRGTADCVRQARKLGIPVEMVTP